MYIIMVRATAVGLRSILMSGPWASHEEAVRMIRPTRRLAQHRDPSVKSAGVTFILSGQIEPTPEPEDIRFTKSEVREELSKIRESQKARQTRKKAKAA